MTSTRSEVVVIGGGVAGISAALELSKTHDVIIIEKKQLFYGSSGRNPGRMGHGFHYIDFETAKLYLEASIQVQRTYPHFLIGEHLPFSHPVRHGRYFVTKTSLYSFTEVLETYQKLQQRYAELVAEDPENKVFGEPESFFRILEPCEYQDHVNAEIIEGGVETCEHLFNWQAFSNHIREIIGANSRIRLYEYSEVLDLAHYEEFGTRFKLIVKMQQSELHEFKTNYIVNSAWENIEQLNDKLGITYINGQRTNRLKCLVEVKLPSSLITVNSSFFCMGSFCMFSNMGDGRAMMTLADVTNMDVSSAKSISTEMARYVNGDISREEKRRIGEEIKAGVATYIPQMINAEVLDVKFGIVQTKGELSLKDLNHREGAHHIRNYHHIREEMQGLIANPAMKLFYFVQNGIRVREIFDTQLARDLVIPEILHTIQRVCSSNRLLESAYFEKEIFRAMAVQIDKMSHVYPELVVQLTTLMEQKKQLNRELLKLDLSKLVCNFAALKPQIKSLVEDEKTPDAAASPDGYLKHLFLSVSSQERSPNASGRGKTTTLTSRQEHSSFSVSPSLSLPLQDGQNSEIKVLSTDALSKPLLIHDLRPSSRGVISSMSPSPFPIQLIDKTSATDECLSHLLLSTTTLELSPNSCEKWSTYPSPRGLACLQADFLDLMKRASVSPGLPLFDRDLEMNCKKPKPVKKIYSQGTYLFSPSTISRAKSDQAIALGSR